jgi:hypothetical protein
MSQTWTNELFAPRRPFPWDAGPAGCCDRCGRPAGRCGCRECRKEPKELLVTAVTEKRGEGAAGLPTGMGELVGQGATSLQLDPTTAGVGLGFIGGDCCVTLAVECAANVATTPFLVAVMVADSEGTTLIWSKTEAAGVGYRVHECVITTKPGSKLFVVVVNCTARVRWCEVFSC